ncbi:hypothetical protein ES707_16513 [subsurface metagenome]
MKEEDKKSGPDPEKEPWAHPGDPEEEEQKEFLGYKNEQIEAAEGKILPTDVGNADRLVRDFGHLFKHNCIHDYFLIWNGKYWEKDDIGKVYSFAEHTGRNIYLEAGLIDDPKDRNNLGKWANTSQNLYRLKAMVELTKYKSNIPVRPKDLDKDKYLFNVNNGTLDLQIGKKRKHNPDDLITRIAPIDYDVSAECPNWLEFLNLTLSGNEDNIKFLQKAVGYSMIGKTSERCFFILFGDGYNGKSTFIRTISTIFGDYAMSTPTSTLMSKYQEGIPNDLARLDGPRFVSCDEGDEHQRLNAGLVKQMTGQDLVKARFMRGEWFEYYPEFKIWFATNHKPIIRETTRAIWDRVREIPFTVQIPEKKRVADFFEKSLLPELSGILAWCKEGFDLYQFEGLEPPDDVKNAVLQYRNEMDVIQGFLDDFCDVNTEEELGDRNELMKLSKYDLEQRKIYTINATDLHSRWAAETGGKISRSNFGRKLMEKGFVSKRFRDGIEWFGIKFIDIFE